MHDIRPFIPELFDKPGTLLYIGARVDAHSWLDNFISVGHKVTILEIWHPNVSAIIDSPLFDQLEDVIEGNTLTEDIGRYDYIVWWHGPEHLPLNDTVTVLAKLLDNANRVVAVACPYGFYPQRSHNSNPHEEHKTTIYPTFFELLGMNVRTNGKADDLGSDIVAWKVKNE